MEGGLDEIISFAESKIGLQEFWIEFKYYLLHLGRILVVSTILQYSASAYNIKCDPARIFRIEAICVLILRFLKKG